MGMTIDEIISDLTELKICGVVPFTKGTISGGNYKVITGDCVDEAVTILRKYQKIKQIFKDIEECPLVEDNALEEIKEIVNGNDD